MGDFFHGSITHLHVMKPSTEDSCFFPPCPHTQKGRLSLLHHRAETLDLAMSVGIIMNRFILVLVAEGLIIEQPETS